MATLKLNSQTVVSESGGTLTAPALNITTGTLASGVNGFGLIRNAQQFRLVGDVDGSGGAGDAGAVIGKK